MRRVVLTAAVAAVASMAFAGVASAAPYTLQRYTAKINGSNKAGTSKKPKAISVTLNPHHDVGLAGGNTNTGSLNTGAVMEAPFATVLAYTWFPKEIKVDTSVIPGCAEKVILATPDKCPKGSEVGTANAGGRDPVTGKDKCEDQGTNDKGQPIACTVYAAGLIRKKDLAEGVGTYTKSGASFPNGTVLSVRIFAMNKLANGKSVKNTLALRVVSPVSGNVIIRAEFAKVSAAEKAQFGASRYTTRTKFSIPTGLIEPLPGFMSQLTDFNAGLKAISKKGKPFFGLAGCPASKKLDFGYNGQYNLALDRNSSPKNAPENGGFSINSTGPIVSSEVPCT